MTRARGLLLPMTVFAVFSTSQAEGQPSAPDAGRSRTRERQRWEAGVSLLADHPMPVDGDPSAFTVVSVLHDDEALNRPHDVELDGDLAFVAGKGGSIAILDVADPAAPRVLWSRLDPKGLEDAETVLPMDGRLLLGARDLFSLDIRDSRNPVVEKTITDRTRIDRINGMVKRGDALYAACKHGWVAMFELHEPSSPSLVGSLNVREAFGLQTPHDVDAAGDHVIVVDPGDFGRTKRPGRIAVWRVADRQTHQPIPPSQWQLDRLIAERDLAGVNRVQIAGQFAYVACSRSGDGPSRIGVIDLRDPEKATVAATLPFAEVRGANGLTIAGRVLFAAGQMTVDAIDVSDPHRPVRIGARRLPALFPDATSRKKRRHDDAHDLVYRDGYLYVTAQTSNRFGILKVSPKIEKLAFRLEDER